MKNWDKKTWCSIWNWIQNGASSTKLSFHWRRNEEICETSIASDEEVTRKLSRKDQTGTGAWAAKRSHHRMNSRGHLMKRVLNRTATTPRNWFKTIKRQWARFVLLAAVVMTCKFCSDSGIVLSKTGHGWVLPSRRNQPSSSRSRRNWRVASAGSLNSWRRLTQEGLSIFQI